MYKIIKEIHSYLPKTRFIVYEKFLWKWIPSEDFSICESYELAEKAITEELTRKRDGIVELKDGVYKFYPLTL